MISTIQIWDPIKRGGIRCVKCRLCGLEFFEGDSEHTEEHERIHTYNPQERAAEKAASRAEDQRKLDAGEITREELRRQNASFAFPPGQVKIRLPKKEK